VDQRLEAVFLGVGFFALQVITLRRSHRTWTKALVPATALGVLYGVGWVVTPIVSRAFGIEIVGLIGLIALSILMALVIYSNLRKEDSRL
jgi:hypothetical protein